MANMTDNITMEVRMIFNEESYLEKLEAIITACLIHHTCIHRHP